MGKTCCHDPLSDEAVKNILSEKGINKTKIKISILRELSRSRRPLSVQEIHDVLKQVCDLSTVFRTITQFKDKNLITEVNLDEGFFRYEIAAQKGKIHHHHHVRCRKCGHIQNIEKCDLSEFENAISRLGFTEMEHRLEFSGLCSKCRKKNQS
jgi:Fur family ferric uptake transcriptional regulator